MTPPPPTSRADVPGSLRSPVGSAGRSWRESRLCPESCCRRSLAPHGRDARSLPSTWPEIRPLRTRLARPRVVRRSQATKEPRHVNLAVAQGRKIGDALASPLVFQMDMPEPLKCEADVVFRRDAGEVDDVGGIVVELNPVVPDLS